MYEVYTGCIILQSLHHKDAKLNNIFSNCNKKKADNYDIPHKFCFLQHVQRSIFYITIYNYNLLYTNGFQSEIIKNIMSVTR